MVVVRAVAAWVVDGAWAQRVVGPAYDALRSEERRALAEADADSFFNVLRSPVDYGDADPEELLAGNAVALERLLARGRYIRPSRAGLYLYALRSDSHEQTAVVGDLPIAAVLEGGIRPHERTRSAKEAELAGHLRHLRMQSSPVGLTYRARPEIDALVAEARQRVDPLVELVTTDGLRQQVWAVPDDLEGPLIAAFAEVATAYIVDGHHRVAATLRTGDDAFLAGLVPDDQLHLLPYHRVVAGPLPLRPLVTKGLLGRRRGVERLDGPLLPERPGTAVVGIDGSWFRVPLHPSAGQLDVDAAASVLLEPLAGVTDPRTDPRLDFVPGTNGDGLDRLVQLVAEGGFAVALYPPSVAELVAEADAGRTMPPKSTWFEPKLRSGVFIVLRPALPS